MNTTHEFSLDYSNRAKIIQDLKKERKPKQQIELDLLIISKNIKGFHVTPKSVVYVSLEGFYQGKTFLPLITIPFTMRSLKWGWSEKSEAEKLLPIGCSFAVLSLLFDHAFVGCATFRGRKAFLRDVETRFINSEGIYEKLMITKGDEVDFYITIDQVEQTIDPILQPLIPTKHSICLLALLTAKLYMATKSFEAAASKLDVVLRHIFILDPKQNVDLIPAQTFANLNQIPLIALRLYAELYGKLNEKLFGVKDAINRWDQAIELVKSLNPLEENEKFLGTAYFERGLLQWNIKEWQSSLKDFKIALHHHQNIYQKEVKFINKNNQLMNHFWEGENWEFREMNILKIKKMIVETEVKIASYKRRHV